MPIWVWTHIWGSKFYSRKRETLLRFSPVLDLYGHIYYLKSCICSVYFCFFYSKLAIASVLVSKQICIYAQREHKDDTQPSFHQIVSFLLPTPLFSVCQSRRMEWPSAQRQGLRQRYSSGRKKGRKKSIKDRKQRRMKMHNQEGHIREGLLWYWSLGGSAECRAWWLSTGLKYYCS